jgi:hypothetical protein
MRCDELARLLTSPAEVQAVIQAIDNPVLGVQRGWDLTLWAYRAGPGSVFFVEHDPQGQALDAVVAVEASQDHRERISQALASFPIPTTLVLIGS